MDREHIRAARDLLEVLLENRELIREVYNRGLPTMMDRPTAKIVNMLIENNIMSSEELVLSDKFTSTLNSAAQEYDDKFSKETLGRVASRYKEWHN